MCTHHWAGSRFQSTLPLRGATLTGDRTDTIADRFQSTLPLRGATMYLRYVGALHFISIHAPLTGSDKYGTKMEQSTYISIHAPLTGSDI